MEANDGATAALLTFLIDQILKEAQDQATPYRVQCGTH
jgi:hypothetical protein